jgi:hypothetical protein
MPKRIVDGEGIWRSDKLQRLVARWRPEYANLVPLALANGTFEANPRRIWAQVYSYNRPDMTAENVSAILDALEYSKLLFRWTDQPSGKVWGYWVGIDKPGRLPGKSRRGKNEAVGPDPPFEELRSFLDSNGIHSETNGIHSAANGNEKLLGSGFGFGSGSGFGIGRESETSEAKGASDPPSFAPRSKIQRRPSRSMPEAAVRLAEQLSRTVTTNHPTINLRKNWRDTWAAEADRMMRLDGRGEEDLSALIAWCAMDPFWRSVILSMTGLRKNYDAAFAQYKNARERQTVESPAQWAARMKAKHTGEVRQ